MTSTGVPALDRLLAGGYPPNSAVLVEGPSGSEKDMVAYRFISAGLGEGEFCAYVTRLPPSEMILDAKAFGIDFGLHPPYWMSPEGGDRGYSINDLATISFGIKETLRGREGACFRVVIDGLSQLLMLHSTDSVYRFLSQLLPELKKLNAVVIATVQGEMHSPQVLSAIELLFDGVVEVGGAGAETELRVKKMRGVSLSAKTSKVGESGNAEGAPPASRIAVIPFTNFSPDPNDEYLSDGLTEELISTLSRVDGLEVIARTSMMRYKAAPKPIREVATELNAGTVLEGSTRKAGKKLRVAVQMIDAMKEKHLWAENFDREMEDIFAIQTEICQAVADRVRSKFGEPRTPVVGAKAVDPVAYEYYLKGRHLLNVIAEGAPAEAARYFRLAIERDPGLAKAYSGLADYYSYAADDTLTNAEAYPKAKEYAQKALAIDPESSDAHASLGLIAFLYAWNWKEADAHFADSVRLNPNNAFGWFWRGAFLKTVLRFDEALECLKKASDLDPLSDGTRFLMAVVHWVAHQDELAMEECRKAMDLNPDNGIAHGLLAILKLKHGDRDGALREAKEAARIGGNREGMGIIGFMHARLGQREEAQKIIGELRAGENPDPISTAVALIGLGEKRAASDAVKEGVARHSTYLPLFGLNPIFEELLDDKEVADLFQTAGMRRDPARQT